MPIPVVDIFAGAGGLGEGFEAYEGGGHFHVALSAEMDGHAVDTLRTRAFFRSFPPGEAPPSYYAYLKGTRATPWAADHENIWESAVARTCQIELGKPDHDRDLDERIAKIAKEATNQGQPWVLVGGPPCQAFSLVGRARNRGVEGYVPEEDERHFLYRHYLHILSKHRPAVFVLENVKGMLSSKVGGAHIFREIFEQLQRPGGENGPRYRIEPIVQEKTGGWLPKDFIVRGESLGVPQNRHRVVLVGVLEEVGRKITPLRQNALCPTLHDMIADLPRVRSDSTDDPIDSWSQFASRNLLDCARYARSIDRDTASHLRELAPWVRGQLDPGTGEDWAASVQSSTLPKHLRPLMRDTRVRGVVHHMTRAHMRSDLLRYAYAAAFAEVHDRSPRGAAEFPVELHPKHQSWTSEKKGFVDRFKVQRWHAPSSTITSHLAKDGHYFIHPDPTQMRSLTIREAARLQTFPDNFFFEGPPGAKRKQIGNAVPPWLAHQIAEVVHGVLG